tara:strand:+ start:1758 stop:2327 length:570 start_codon:yes stop_codon:yes gene_type:complete
MIRIALVGAIGSGKTFISNLFKLPTFNADKIVSKIYSENKKVYFALKRKLPNFFISFPIQKKELIRAIITNDINIKKISKIIHPEVKKELQKFLKKYKKKKAVVLDIPLYFENKLNKKTDIIVFIQTSSRENLKRLKKRRNFNKLIFQKLKKLQLPLVFKKKKSHYIIKNNFKKNLARKNVEYILNRVL